MSSIHKDGLSGLLNILKLKVKEKYLFPLETIAMDFYKEQIHTSRNGHSLFTVFMEMFLILTSVVLGYGEEHKYLNIW